MCSHVQAKSCLEDAVILWSNWLPILWFQLFSILFLFNMGAFWILLEISRVHSHDDFIHVFHEDVTSTDDTDDFDANVISYNSTMSSFARSFRSGVSSRCSVFQNASEKWFEMVAKNTSAVAIFNMRTCDMHKWWYMVIRWMASPKSSASQRDGWNHLWSKALDPQCLHHGAAPNGWFTV